MQEIVESENEKDSLRQIEFIMTLHGLSSFSDVNAAIFMYTVRIMHPLVYSWSNYKTTCPGTNFFFYTHVHIIMSGPFSPTPISYIIFSVTGHRIMGAKETKRHPNSLYYRRVP